MIEKSLLTLREIAELLGIRYRSVIDCKDYFSDYLSGIYDGRHYRYWSDNLDFFESVFTLRDRGYTFSMIKNYLMDEKQGGSRSQALKDLFSSLVDTGEEEGGGRRTDEEVGGGRRTDEEGGGCRRTDEEDRGGTRREEEEGRGRRMNEDKGGRMRTDIDEKSQENVQRTGVSESQLAQLKDEIEKELQEKEATCSSQTEIMVNEKIKILAGVLEETFSKLTDEINGTMGSVCKAINQIQGGMKNIHERLGKMEKDLGVELSEGIKQISLDSENIQVTQPEIKIEFENPVVQDIQPNPDDDDYYLNVDLQFVKESVCDGKPDRMAVMQWIKAEKEKNSETNYAQLARMLNDTGIPTMSGRDSWCRTVIRKMALKLESPNITNDRPD